MSVTHLKRVDKWLVVFFKNGRYVRIGEYTTREEAEQVNEDYKKGNIEKMKRYSPQWYASESKRQLAELPNKYKNSKALNY